ncbi:MAG TPA: hypothetical protein VIW24_20435 [Aldersonia sp.]
MAGRTLDLDMARRTFDEMEQLAQQRRDELAVLAATEVVVDAAAPTRTPATEPQATEPQATEKQVAYALRLIASRIGYGLPDHLARDRADLVCMTRSEISRLITILKEQY